MTRGTTTAAHVLARGNGSSSRWWRVVTGLLVLGCTIPVVAGMMRLRELSLGGPITAQNARFFAAPIPVVLHIVGATMFTVFGAFQLVPTSRGGWRRWHRTMGWILVPCGLVAAGSGLWMQFTYALPPSDGPLLGAFRLLFGSALIVCLVLGVIAIRRKDVARHRAWMLRAYAIGMGAATQSLILFPWVMLLGQPPPLLSALLMGAGWVLNLAVAERSLSAQRRRIDDRALAASWRSAA